MRPQYSDRPGLKPQKEVFEIGRTRFGQRLTLEREGQAWTLIQHASSQRDETQYVHVTDEIAAAIVGKAS